MRTRPTQKKPELFDYVNAINNKAKITMDQQTYSPFVINRLFSCDMSTVMFANEINKYSQGKVENFDFYFHALPRGKRFIRYNAKKEKADKTLQHIMEYYGCGMSTAKTYARLLSKEELAQIDAAYERRGICK